MQDILSKVLINLASGSLQIVLLLYLVLYQGAGMWTQQVVFFKEMWEQRSRHQVLGRMRVGGLCKLLLWRSCASSIISQSRLHAWSPTVHLLCFSSFYIVLFLIVVSAQFKNSIFILV
jgi:hypothetical protein